VVDVAVGAAEQLDSSNVPEFTEHLSFAPGVIASDRAPPRLRLPVDKVTIEKKSGF
jgi:hypothetical protein